MMYSDFADYPSLRDRQRYPVIAHVFIPSGQFRAFEDMIEDQTQTKMLGHDVTDSDEVQIYVACASDEIKAMIESRWG